MLEQMTFQGEHANPNEGIIRRKLRQVHKQIGTAVPADSVLSTTTTTTRSFWTKGFQKKEQENHSIKKNNMGNVSLSDELVAVVDASARDAMRHQPSSSVVEKTTTPKTLEEKQDKEEESCTSRLSDRVNILPKWKVFHGKEPHQQQQPQQPHWTMEATQNVKKWWDHIVSQLLQDDDNYQQIQQNLLPKTPKVLLCGCETADQHWCKVECLISIAKQSYGIEGLNILGFEYRSVPCPTHTTTNHDHSTDSSTTYDEESLLSCSQEAAVTDQSTFGFLPDTTYLNGKDPMSNPSKLRCPDCSTRLFHRITPTMHYHPKNNDQANYYYKDAVLITSSNRQQFIADGEMFEEVARLCQEYAQDCMMKAGSLKWTTICDDSTKGEPIRVLIDADHHIIGGSTSSSSEKEETPTLLVTTGKGKVRAGIFSRRHLITTGLEASTALPMVMEAKHRGMRVIILDPNARGDRMGMTTYEKSVETIFFGNHTTGTSVQNNNHEFSSCEDTTVGMEEINREVKYMLGPLYILAHSASGAQLVRYLLDRTELLPHIKAIAFTDSTHNIQWAKKCTDLHHLLQSDKALYFKTSASEEAEEVAGSKAETDNYWEHRFGTIKTVWAGTEEHSLSNYTAHSHIWQHFDNPPPSSTNDI